MIPFKVERMRGSTLVEQVVDGLRQAILSGFYKPGDLLPPITDLAKGLGVSDIVTRAAVKTLAEEHLIYSRPSAGSIVLDSDERRWKGRVLLVRRNEGCGYYDNVFASVLRGLLAKDGWLCTSVSSRWASRLKDTDVSELKVLATRSVSLAIVLFNNPAAEKFLSDTGVPYVVLGDKKPSRSHGCAGYVHYDRAAVGGQFAAACSAAGVKRVVQVGMRESGDVRDALRKAGIVCESWHIEEHPKAISPDFYSEAGRATFAESLRSGKALPDAFYFTDDYVCAGALAALAYAGIRAPQDVRVATWANKGNVPVYARTLSRVELDPWKNAEDVHAFCRSILSGDHGVKPPVLSPIWVEGSTMGGAK